MRIWQVSALLTLFFLFTCSSAFAQSSRVTSLECKDLSAARTPCTLYLNGRKIPFRLRPKRIIKRAVFQVDDRQYPAPVGETFRGRTKRGLKPVAFTMSEKIASLSLQMRRRSRLVTVLFGPAQVEKIRAGKTAYGIAQTARSYSALGCQTAHPPANQDSPATAQAQVAEMQMKKLNLTAYAAKKMVTDLGDETATLIAAVMNGVDAIYNDQVAIDLEVEIILLTNTIIGGGTDINEVLSLFTDFWQANQPDGSNQGTLFSTKNFAAGSSGAVGIGFVGTICQSFDMFSTAVVQWFINNNNLNKVITAHELGHNFSATHTSSGTIMDTTVAENKMDFDPFSMGQITTYSDNNVQCLIGGGSGNGGSGMPDVSLAVATHRGNKKTFVIKVKNNDLSQSLTGCQFQVLGARSKDQATNLDLQDKWFELAQLSATDLVDGEAKVVFKGVKRSAKNTHFNVYTFCPTFSNLPTDSKVIKKKKVKTKNQSKKKFLNTLSQKKTPEIK